MVPLPAVAVTVIGVTVYVKHTVWVKGEVTAIVGNAFIVNVTTAVVIGAQGVLVTMALMYFVTVKAPIVAPGKVAAVTPVPVRLVKFTLSVETCH